MNKIVTVALLGLLLIGGFAFHLQQSQSSSESSLVPLKVETASLGGSFTLTDHTGRTVTQKAYRGRHLLVFFGYTHCPDLCPVSLQVMTEALEILGEPLASKVVPLFISVDPDRDTPDHLAEYRSYFHPNLQALTGTQAQLAAVAKAYRVTFRLNAPGPEGDYSVDHTSLTYLMGPDARYVSHFPYDMDPEIMAAELRRHLSTS